MVMTPFKICPFCNATWRERDDFLCDEHVTLIGYQADFSNKDRGVYLFNHTLDGCGSTLALEVAKMEDLFNGPILENALVGTPECQGHCLTVRNLEKCDAPCKNARVRNVMQTILSYGKHS